MAAPKPGHATRRPQSSKEAGLEASLSHPVAGPLETMLLAPASLSPPTCLLAQTPPTPHLCPYPRPGRLQGGQDLSLQENHRLLLLARGPADGEGCFNPPVKTAL